MPKTKYYKEDKVETKEKSVEEKPLVYENIPLIKEEVKPKKVFDQSDGIICRSVVQGGLYMEGLKTQIIYNWADYGDESEVEYRDLAAAVRSKSKFLFNPWIIVEDKDFIEEFPQLSKFYEDSYTVKELRNVLDMPVDQMVAAIEKLPDGAKESLKTIAAKQVSMGILDSVNKIRALDKIFGTDLNLLSEFVQNE